MFVEAIIVGEALGVAYFLNMGPARTFRPYAAASSGGSVYTLPPVVITPDDSTPAEVCKTKIDAFVAKLPEASREVIRQAIAIGNPMQIDALATEVETVDPVLAACLRAQKKYAVASPAAPGAPDAAASPSSAVPASPISPSASAMTSEPLSMSPSLGLSTPASPGYMSSPFLMKRG